MPSDPVDSLIADLLAWIGPEPRPYAEVLDAWRTSCPRLPVWETANARGYITRGRGAVVSVSPAGLEYLTRLRDRRGSAIGLAPETPVPPPARKAQEIRQMLSARSSQPVHQTHW